MVDIQDRLSAEELNAARTEARSDFSAPRFLKFYCCRLSITAKPVIAIVISAASISAPIAPVWNSQHTIHGTDRTADARSNCTANHSTYRSRGTSAFARTAFGSTNDTLRMGRMRNGE